MESSPKLGKKVPTVSMLAQIFFFKLYQSTVRTIESWIVAMDMLQELFGNQKFFDFSMGEERWKLMMTYMEQVLAGRAGEIPVRLGERFAFAKAISAKISFRSLVSTFVILTFKKLFIAFQRKQNRSERMAQS